MKNNKTIKSDIAQIREVKLSENFFNNILNFIGDPVFVKDADSKFIFVNNSLCDMLGMKKEDILGKTLGESLPKAEMDLFLKNDRMVISSGKDNISEEPLTGKGGKVFNIITKKTRYLDEKGNKFLIGVIHDITYRKNMELELQDKISELERTNKLMVGRELKMLELKKEINELKKLNK